MLIKRAADIRSSEITDKRLYLNRRAFIQAATGTIAAAAAGLVGSGELHAAAPAPHGRKLENVKKSAFSTAEKVNTWEQITTYNNFYEFGTTFRVYWKRMHAVPPVLPVILVPSTTGVRFTASWLVPGRVPSVPRSRTTARTEG